MNSNNTTSNNLKINTMGLSFRGLLKRPAFWLGMLLTVVVFSVLINLGFWQLSRAEEKQQLEQHLSDYANRERIPLTELEINKQAYVTGLPVKASLSPVDEKYLLLDNQTYEGRVGYLAYQLMQLENDQYALVERGFVEASKMRSELPNVDWIEDPVSIKARLYQKSANPLSQDLHFELGSPHRIQNLNIEQLEQQWGVRIAPYVIQPQMETWPYPQPWQPIPLKAEKHLGYAVQWFSMAGALCLLSLWVLIRALRKGVHHE